jgi:metal-responsive CopG/Arc/MetJ family transcriptional regulator
MARKQGNMQVSCTLPENLIRQLDDIAGKEYILRSQLVRKILIDWLKEKEQKK